jgi:glycosyltransferase involved in cell wall biosynthesis
MNPSPTPDKNVKGVKRLMYLPLERMSDALGKGNVEYARHYESYFDEVQLVYFYGRFPDIIHRGKTTWRSLGGKHHKIDLLLAPLRLLRTAFALKPTAFLTSDLVFSWWTAALLRMIYRGRVVLMPICLPEEIYANTQRSLCGIPIWLERFFMRLSFMAASKIIVSSKNKASITWLRSDRKSSTKIQVVDVIPEQYPPPRLLDELLQNAKLKREFHEPARLLYVGRVHWQKLTLELVELMRELMNRGIAARLWVAGGGVDMPRMQERAKLLKVDGSIEWLGFIDETRLAEIYQQADIFVSTVTGTALREAGFSGLPVVGYDINFFNGLLRHEHNALLAPVHDVAALATQIDRVIRDHELRNRIATNLHSTICAGWDRSYIPRALRDVFNDTPA